MAFFQDEAARETMQPAGGGVFNLLGAVDGRQAFSACKRKDNTSVQSGDKTCVTVVQKVAGVTLRAVAIGTLTLGGSNLITLNTTPYPSGKMYMSTSGLSFPGFNTLDTGEVFITTAVPLIGQFDDDGNLLDPFNYRKTMHPAALATFLAEIGGQDNEAVMALFRSGNFFTGLAGLFAQNHNSVGSADGIDKFINPNTGQGRVDRVPIKVGPTYRDNTIGAGGVFDIPTAILNASEPNAEWIVTAWKQGDPATRLKFWVHGHASDPLIFDIEYSAIPPLLKPALSGTTIRLNNASGASGQYAYTVERVS